VTENGAKSIEEFLRGYKKGSKKFRKVFGISRNSNVILKETRCLTTFRNLVGTDLGPDLDYNKLLEQWTAIWAQSFLSNDFRVFIFNCRYNMLPLNNRLNSYNAEIDPRCSFCRILSKDCLQRDSFIHCFFDCPVTKKLLLYTLGKLDLNILLVEPEIFRICYWYGIYTHTEMTTSKNFLLTLIFDVFRYLLFKHRLRRHIPNSESFFSEFRFFL
jgi:hypothetical protein